MSDTPLVTPEIPVNVYDRELRDCGYGKRDIERVYRDMLFIREFESAIEQSHNNGLYAGIAYKYSGPSHLAIGQEAVAVGQALALDTNDFAFGTHRSHGELIARGLRFGATATGESFKSVIEKDGKHTYDAVKGYFNGDVEHDVALFTLYGAFAEIFGKKSGFQHGLGGSMHAYFTPFGVYPNNAIVGGSAPLALGAALYKLTANKNGIAVANMGDGAVACGSVYEAMNFASMNQFRNIWDTKRGLPLLFIVTDNVYARGGNTHTETSGMGIPARLGAGINPESMHAEAVDGFDPFAVADAVLRKKKLLKDGRGPALLSVSAYRFTGHSLGDGEHYRSREEVEQNRKKDPIEVLGNRLCDSKISSSDELENIKKYVKDLVKQAFALAVDEGISHTNEDIRDTEYLSRITLAEIDSPAAIDKEPLAKTARLDVTYRDALAEVVKHALTNDNNLIAYGEDVRGYGSSASVFDGLESILPHKKLFNAPIAESSIIGSATGYAMCGGRALIELLYADFLTRGADELINQLAKWRGLSGGTLDLAVTLRLPVGKGYGAQHSQDPVSILAGVPGINIVYPATPYDAKGLLLSALNTNAPVVFIESRALYKKTERFRKNGVPETPYKIRLGVPDIKKTGTDITILTIGGALYSALTAQDERPEISMEIIDARSIVPFDYGKVFDSVKKTGRLIVAGECTARASVLNEFAMTVQKECFRYLKAPVAVVGAPDTIIPNSEDYYDFPRDIIDKANALLAY